MAVFRIEKTRDYTVMSNYHLRDRSLSLKAKGLLSLMLSLPEDWDYTMKGLARICKDGIDSISGGIRELETHGYLVRARVRNENGQLGSIEYTILERPKEPAQTPAPVREKPIRENPIQVNPMLDAPIQENPAQLNTKEQNKELSITQGSSPIPSSPPIMGSKTGLEAIEKTVIDRAVQKIYQPYFADPRPENMPILSDLMAALTAQHIPEADRVAQALDLYVNGSLNFFNHRTTVDIRNRLVCFDIKGLGKNLKKPGMLIVQDAVWNTVTVNRSIGRATWYFVDEFHLLLKEEQTAAYSAEIWKRFRKWGGVPTGATQNPKDLLHSPEIENILENSDFIYLLNLSAGDRKLMTERLNISAEQLAFVTNADPGSGLLFFQNVILPFRDEFPKDTELYRLLTTKPSEVAHDGQTG